MSVACGWLSGKRLAVLAAIVSSAMWTTAATLGEASRADEEASTGAQLLAAVREGDLSEVRRLVSEVRRLAEEGADVPTRGWLLYARIAAEEGTEGAHEEIAALLEETTAALEETAAAVRKDRIQAAWEDLMQAAPEDRVQAAREPSRRVGDRFRDCRGCPEMIVLPAGEFEMGSPATEEGRQDWEGPMHRVAIEAPIAMGLQEVTVREFRRFVAQTGYSTGDSCWTREHEDQDLVELLEEMADKNLEGVMWFGIGFLPREGRDWRNPGFRQGDNHPVACASWDDARAYVHWLSKTTGEGYRLPSEAEWEYAARAGTTRETYWSDEAPGRCAHASFANFRECNDGHARSAPGRSYTPNDFGLYDMMGNVWEWTADCIKPSYRGAPGDGTSWEDDNCARRAVRGGSWHGGWLTAFTARSAERKAFPRNGRAADTGFRVVRSMRMGARPMAARADGERPRPTPLAVGEAVGERFRDCPNCPEMVVVPGGSFERGSPRGEDGRYRNEGPVRSVSIASRFAIGVHEVTRREFDTFVAEAEHPTGEACSFVYRGLQTENGVLGMAYDQPDSHPAVCVNWHDATAYTRWLSRQTEEDYRLPSEAEWEYAARGGSTAATYWVQSGNRRSRRAAWFGQCGHANGADQAFVAVIAKALETPDAIAANSPYFVPCEDWHGELAPVGVYRPNGFGLYDVIGNVSEWTEDCWHKNYRRAPNDGSARTDGDCEFRVGRGGAFTGASWTLRSAYRVPVSVDDRLATMGFRVVRSLAVDANPRQPARSD